jgi:hypothetical protein
MAQFAAKNQFGAANTGFNPTGNSAMTNAKANLFFIYISPLLIAIKGSYNFVVVLLKRFYVNKFLSQSLWHIKKIKLELIWSNLFHVL